MPPLSTEPYFFDFSRWPTDHWKKPLSLTIAVHLAAFLLLLLSPYMHSRAPMLDVQTVDLFTATEIETQPAPRAPAPPAPAPPKSKTPASDAVSIAPSIPQTGPQEVITLRPLKTKEKIKSPKDDLKVKQTILERKLRQVQASIESERAQATAKKQVETAIDSIRQSLASRTSETNVAASADTAESVTTGTPATAGRGSSGSLEVSEAKKRYYAAIQMHLGQFWTLPESNDWKESLEVIAVLWFRADGTIIKRAYEKQSANDFFNRFVQLTLEKVERVPPLPLDLPAYERQEILTEGLGFRFHPSGIY
jgi:hypothetical protein